MAGSLRILYLVPDNIAPDEDSGATVHIREVVACFQKQGCEVLTVYFLPASSSKKTDFPRVADFHILQWCKNHFPKVLRSLKIDISYVMRNLQFYRKITKTLSATGFKPDFIYERSCYLQIIGMRMAKNLQLPIFYELNRPLVDEARQFWGSKLVRIAQTIEAWKYKHAAAIFSVGTIHKHINCPHGNFIPIQNGIAESVLLRVRTPDPMRKQMRLQNKIVVGFVGYVLPWYNLNLLEHACAQLTPGNHRIHFLVVGWGDTVAATERSVQSKGLSSFFTFTGRLPRQEVVDILGVIHIGTIPFSEPYASNMKLFEYAAASIPLLAPAYENLQDLFVDGEECLFFQPNDPVDFTKKLQRLIENENLRRQMAINLKQRVARDFTWEKIVHHELAVIKPFLIQKT